MTTAVHGAPPLTCGDVQTETITLLRQALAARSETYAAGVSLGARVPAGAEIPPLPYLLCRVDAVSPADAPITQRHTVRVTVWHRDEDSAFDLAMLAHALLLVSGSTSVAAYLHNSGVLRSLDPDTQVDLASFTVAAITRAVALDTPPGGTG